MMKDILLKNLEKRGFIPFYYDKKENAVNKIVELIPKNCSVGFGGSMTLHDLGIPLLLHNLNYTVFIKDFYKNDDIYLKQHTADWYLTSTNALTVDGEFINIDGRANRVGAMVSGPMNQIFVLGVNKIVNNVDEGIKRTRNVASPLNTVRLHKQTPCAVTGKCENCFSPDKICNTTVILHHPTAKRNIYVIIINENLGY